MVPVKEIIFETLSVGGFAPSVTDPVKEAKVVAVTMGMSLLPVIAMTIGRVALVVPSVTVTL